MIKNISAFLFFILFFLFPCLASPAEIEAAEILVCYTNSLNGYIDYCHCKGEPRGGLVKRSTVIKNLRAKNPELLLFETGDFFHFEKDTLLAEYIIKTYRHIRYDVVLFGDQEFSSGIDEFLRYRRSLPFICNNVLIKKSGRAKRYFPRYRIIKKKGVSIGVIGSLHPHAFKYYSSSVTSRVTVTGQEKEIARDIAALKKKGVKFIILLSHSGYGVDKKLAGRFSDIDLIVGGHSQTLLRQPVKKEKTLIVQAGGNGARIGILRLKLRGGRIVSYKNRFLHPNDKWPADDPAVRRMINEYSKRLKNKYKGLKFNQ